MLMDPAFAQAHEIPANAFVYRLTVGDDQIDIQSRVSNHAIVEILSDAAWAHSIALGWGVEEYKQLGKWWVVRRHEVDYLGGAVLGDELVCYTWPSGLTRATAQRRHVLVRPADETVIAKALNTWAVIDVASNRPARVPPELAASFNPDLFV
jgi:acyl-CoA thioester hydrolase